MLRFLVLLSLAASTFCSGLEERSLPRVLFSAATPAQIRFAEENKYDDTGPGAKDPNSNLAYRTYKNLEEALVAYLDDADTKLPEAERAQAIESLNGVKGYGPQPFLDKLEIYRSKAYDNLDSKQVDLSDLRINQHDFSLLSNLPSYQSPFRWQKLKEIRPNPLSISHYTKEPVDQYNGPSDAYNVYDNTAEAARFESKTLKALKSPYRGYYTYRDRNGQLTVRYSDPRNPFYLQ